MKNVNSEKSKKLAFAKTNCPESLFYALFENFENTEIQEKTKTKSKTHTFSKQTKNQVFCKTNVQESYIADDLEYALEGVKKSH